jgi:hypothetical protein
MHNLFKLIDKWRLFIITHVVFAYSLFLAWFIGFKAPYGPWALGEWVDTIEPACYSVVFVWMLLVIIHSRPFVGYCIFNLMSGLLVGEFFY